MSFTKEFPQTVERPADLLAGLSVLVALAGSVQPVEAAGTKPPVAVGKTITNSEQGGNELPTVDNNIFVLSVGTPDNGTKIVKTKWNKVTMPAVLNLVNEQAPTADRVVTGINAPVFVTQDKEGVRGFLGFAPNDLNYSEEGSLVLAKDENGNPLSSTGIFIYEDPKHPDNKFALSTWFSLPGSPIYPAGGYLVVGKDGTSQIGFMDSARKPYFSGDFATHSLSQNLGADPMVSFSPEGFPMVVGDKGKFVWKDGNWVDLNSVELKPALTVEAKTEMAKFTTFDVQKEFPNAVFDSELGLFVVGEKDGQKEVLVPHSGERQANPSSSKAEVAVNGISPDGLYGMRDEPNFKKGQPEDYKALVAGVVEAGGHNLIITYDSEGPIKKLENNPTFFKNYLQYMADKNLLGDNKKHILHLSGWSMEATLTPSHYDPTVEGGWYSIWPTSGIGSENHAPYVMSAVNEGIVDRNSAQKSSGVEDVATYTILRDTNLAGQDIMILRPDWVDTAISYSNINKENIDQTLQRNFQQCVWESMLYGFQGKKSSIVQIWQYESDIMNAYGKIEQISLTIDNTHPQVVAAKKLGWHN